MPSALVVTTSVRPSPSKSPVSLSAPVSADHVAKSPTAPLVTVQLPLPAAVAIGMVNALVLNFSPAWHARGRRELSQRENRQLAWMGGTSLACWLTAIGAGRMIAYW